MGGDEGSKLVTENVEGINGPKMQEPLSPPNLGYTPVGDYAATVGDVVDWLVRLTGPDTRLPDNYGADYFTGRFNYQREDAFLAIR